MNKPDTTKPPSQNQIAAALGIAKSRVSVLKNQGMPVHSIEAAMAWRRATMNPCKLKPPPRPPAPPAPAPAVVLTAQTLMQAAGLILTAGGDITPLKPGLRSALRAVPPGLRDDVELDIAVMRVLLAPLLELIDREKAASPDPEPPPEDDEANAEAGSWLYAFACGEVNINLPA